MRVVSKVAIAVFALALAGCELGPLKRANTPPAPTPAVAKSEPPPEPQRSEPLSIPQTQVQLPRVQPIDPEALATPPTIVPAESASQRQKHAATRRPTTGAASPPPVSVKPDPVESADAPPQPEPTRARLEPVLPADQRRRLVEDIASRLKEVEQLLDKISGKRLSSADKESVEQIRFLGNQSHQALEQGELEKAGNLATRALFLAQDLLGAKQ